MTTNYEVVDGYIVDKKGIPLGDKFKITGTDISDGYHTFKELYEHRCLLWIVLCSNLKLKKVWVAEHHEGWDLIVLTGPVQISYHVPMKYRPLYEHKSGYVKKEKFAEYDGHTSVDVLSRLLDLIGDENTDEHSTDESRQESSTAPEPEGTDSAKALELPD